MHEAMQELGDHIRTTRPDCVLDATVTSLDELVVHISPSSLVSFCDYLRADRTCQFTTLIDITAVDYPERDTRFEVVYHFLSMYQNQRIRLKVDLREDEILPSIMPAFKAANWFERELFDMFGILVSGHPDLRRILTDYGFRGHPLRKDFPTTGYTEVRYDETVKRVVYEPVSLVQEYRQFDFMSPWEGADYILPGDEKTDEAK